MAGYTYTTSALDGGQPQRMLASQGEVRPGVVQGQYWTSRIWWETVPLDALPYASLTKLTPAASRRSNPVAR